MKKRVDYSKKYAVSSNYSAEAVSSTVQICDMVCNNESDTCKQFGRTKNSFIQGFALVLLCTLVTVSYIPGQCSQPLLVGEL